VVRSLGVEDAVLVRPDGVVAWRSRTADGAASAQLSAVVERMLTREARAGAS